MTLRLRLVAGLVALMAVGLAIFGFTTYELYSLSLIHISPPSRQASPPCR